MDGWRRAVVRSLAIAMAQLTEPGTCMTICDGSHTRVLVIHLAWVFQTHILLADGGGGGIVSSSVTGRHVVRSGTHGGAGQRTGRIDQRFFRTWSRCPLIMETDGGGYLCTIADMISGKMVRKPALIAQQRVDRAGDPIAACRNMMR